MALFDHAMLRCGRCNLPTCAGISTGLRGRRLLIAWFKALAAVHCVTLVHKLAANAHLQQTVHAGFMPTTLLL